MFGLQERVFSVIGQDRYDRLGDHRTSVHCWGHPMDRTAGELLISFERLALRVKAGKIRQQRGADVDDPALPAGGKAGVENPHKSGQCDRSTPIVNTIERGGRMIVSNAVSGITCLGLDLMPSS